MTQCRRYLLAMLITAGIPCGRLPADMPKPPVPRTDAYGDPLPPGAVARLGTARLRHGEFLSALVFGADGRGLISGGRDGSIRVWDVATGKELRRLVPRADAGDRSDRSPAVGCLALSPDGELLATGYEDGSVRLWQIRTGRVVRRFRAAYRADTNGVAFSRDGRRLAFGTNHITLCDIATGRVCWRTAALDPLILCLAFSPDGKWLASGGDDGLLCLRDPATGDVVRRFQGPAERACSLSFSPDGKRLVSAAELRSVCLWDVPTGKKVRDLVPELGGCHAVAFSPDGKTIAGAWGGIEPRLWDAATGKTIRRLAWHTRWVMAALAFSRDGKLLAVGCVDGSIRVWKTATGQSLHPLLDERRPVIAVDVAPDGRRLVAAERRLEPLGRRSASLQLWDLATAKPLRQLLGPRDQGLYVAFSSDSQSVAAINAADDTVRVWEVASGRELRRYRAVDRMEFPVALSKDRWPLALAFGGWRPGGARAAVGRIEGLEGADVVAYSADGRRALVGGCDGALTTRDGRTGKSLRRLSEAYRPQSRLALSPDGRTAAAAEDRAALIDVWDTATGEVRFRLDAGGEGLGSFARDRTCLAFSPDGRVLAAGGQDGFIRLFEVAAGKERAYLKGHEGAVDALAFFADGRRLASGGYDTTVLIWDLLPNPQAGQRRLAPAALERLWQDLSSEDVPEAYHAIRELLTVPTEQTLPWLRTHLRATPPVPPERLAVLLSDLDARRFAVRQRATAELAELGKLAEPALRGALAGRPPLEVRRRVEELLARLGRRRGGLTPQQRQAVRAVEILGHLPAAEARPILKQLAAGAAGAPLTREALAALEWLDRRAAGRR